MDLSYKNIFVFFDLIKRNAYLCLIQFRMPTVQFLFDALHYTKGKQYFLGLEKVFSGSSNPSYPGGPFFNLLGLGKNEKKINELKVRKDKLKKQ